MRIPPPSVTTRLLSYLKERLQHHEPPISTKQVRWWIEHQRCRINGHIESFSSSWIHPGDTIDLITDSPPSLQDTVIYESPEFLVVNKPAWTSSEQVSIFFSFPLLHRLDRDTTGVLLLGKSQDIVSAMHALFKERRIRKTYLAWTSPPPKQTRGTISYRLKTSPLREGAVITRCDAKGLESITHWEKEEQKGNQALLRIHPETGRTHQIRAHLQAIGSPILGDTVYGNRKQRALRPLLHAASLEFIWHDHLCSFQAPLPPDFT